MGETETGRMFAQSRGVIDAGDGDFVYRVENSCMRCSRPLGKNEIKVLPPSYIQERDPYVSSGIVRRRYMCLGCYNTLRAATKTKVRYNGTGAGARRGIVRIIAGRAVVSNS